MTILLTSVTGFGFSLAALLPSHIVGALSLVVLLGAMVALYWRHLARVRASIRGCWALSRCT